MRMTGAISAETFYPPSLGVDVGIQISLSRGWFRHRRCSIPEPVALNDRGCYSFLVPFFVDLAFRTGRYIDLRHDLRFTGTHVTEFQAVIAEALAMARERPSVFEVEVEESDEDTLTTVERDVLISLLTSLEELAAIARREHLAIVSEGELTLRTRGILTEAQKQLRLRAAEVGERYLEGSLSMDQLLEAVDDDGDPLITGLTSLVEEGIKGNTQGDLEAHEREIRRVILALRKSFDL